MFFPFVIRGMWAAAATAAVHTWGRFAARYRRYPRLGGTRVLASASRSLRLLRSTVCLAFSDSIAFPRPAVVGFAFLLLRLVPLPWRSDAYWCECVTYREGVAYCQGVTYCKGVTFCDGATYCNGVTYCYGATTCCEGVTYCNGVTYCEGVTSVSYTHLTLPTKA